MPRRTYTQIATELMMRLGNRTDITPDIQAQLIRDAYLNVALMFVHPELQVGTVALTIDQGSDELSPISTGLTPDFWYPTLVRNATDGYIIRQDSIERVQRAKQKPTAPPYTYYWYGQRMVFESYADNTKALEVWYKRRPQDFFLNRSSELDEIFDPIIIIDAARAGFETVRDFDEAAIQLKLFHAEVDRKKLPIEMSRLNDYRQGFKVRTK